MNGTRLADLPGVARLALALFVVLILGFQVAAQANLWVHDGGGGLPGPEAVLWKYHGRPNASRLEQVLDPKRPRSDDRAMWGFLGEDHEIEPRRTLILDWVRAGAPADRWSEVEPIFRGERTCGQCHAPGGKREDLPFDTYQGVLAVTGPDTGMLTTDLLVSAHNHLFAFAVLALLLSLALAWTPGLGRLRHVLVVAAFAGAGIDVASWFLTKSVGSPFQFGVLLGGGLFGAATVAMGLVVLDEVTWRGRVASALVRPRPGAELARP